MITNEQIEIIEKYVNEKYFDRSKIIKYLSIHDIVGNEIFTYADKSQWRNKEHAYTQWLDNEEGYNPLPVDAFIKRVPFYFYVWNGDLNTHGGNLGYIIHSIHKDIKMDPDVLEKTYLDLEYLFYEKKISVYDIFNYMIEQTGLVTQEYFPNWINYLKICEKFGWSEMMPERFITAYNEALEAIGEEPIIYEIHEIGPGDMFYRYGTTIEFEGTFPCDSEGKPILKWIGLNIQNGNEVKCNCKKSEDCRLRVTLTPKIVIHALNCYNGRDEEGDYWYQIYAGPQNMKFDYSILKEQRNRLGFTQQEVADAVEANVRTYQKWENGETKPDGFYLLRLMNWLDISNVQDAIIYTNVREN